MVQIDGSNNAIKLKCHQNLKVTKTDMSVKKFEEKDQLLS